MSRLGKIVEKLESRTVEEQFDASITTLNQARMLWRDGSREAAVIAIGEMLREWGMAIFANHPDTLADLDAAAEAIGAKRFRGVDS